MTYVFFAISGLNHISAAPPFPDIDDMDELGLGERGTGSDVIDMTDDVISGSRRSSRAGESMAGETAAAAASSGSKCRRGSAPAGNAKGQGLVGAKVDIKVIPPSESDSTGDRGDRQ